MEKILCKKTGKLNSVHDKDENVVENNNIITSEKYFYYFGKKKIIHQDDDIPAHIKYLYFGKEFCGTESFYYKDGKIHRENGPAYIKKGKNNNYLEIKFFKNGKHHRDFGPAIIHFYNVVSEKEVEEIINAGNDISKFKKCTFVAYMQNGVEHNEVVPAVIDGSRTLCYINGKLNDLKDHPAIRNNYEYDSRSQSIYISDAFYNNGNHYKTIIYDQKTGNKIGEFFYLMSGAYAKCANYCGPAVIRYNTDGSIVDCEYIVIERNFHNKEEYDFWILQNQDIVSKHFNLETFL